uniref:DUF6534 domain-containing protein n=1 Tax=Mycena chlorophos TaxID=658473 RepID=A0ABQ0M451_MYCCL|nr:predicted protein [Mycena chlorophos]
MGYDNHVRRGHPVTFGLIILFGIIELSLSAWLVSKFNKHHNYSSFTERDRVRFTLFASIWTVVFSALMLILFAHSATGSVLTSVLAHLVFLDAFVYCNQLNALEAFAWLEWIMVTFAIIVVLIRGISAARRGDGYRGGSAPDHVIPRTVGPPHAPRAAARPALEGLGTRLDFGDCIGLLDRDQANQHNPSHQPSDLPTVIRHVTTASLPPTIALPLFLCNPTPSRLLRRSRTTSQRAPSPELCLGGQLPGIWSPQTTNGRHDSVFDSDSLWRMWSPRLIKPVSSRVQASPVQPRSGIVACLDGDIHGSFRTAPRRYRNAVVENTAIAPHRRQKRKRPNEDRNTSLRTASGGLYTNRPLGIQPNEALPSLPSLTFLPSRGPRPACHELDFLAKWCGLRLRERRELQRRTELQCRCINDSTGTVMNWALMGALAVQVFIYFHAFPHDRLPNKLIVLFVVVAELLQTLGDSHDTVQTFGAHWGNFNALDLVGWSWFSVPILGSAIGCVGQLFFAWRIYVIGARKVYLAPLIIVIITIFQFGAGIWTGIQIIQAGRFSLLTFKAMKPPVAWLAATAAADILIVLFTAYYLLKARSPGFSSRTTAAVNRIIMVTIETGIPCAAFALVDLALFVKYQGNNYHLGTCIWLSKVYSNSILAILNSRAQIGHATSGTEPSVVNISHSQGTNRSGSASKRTASTIQFASSFPHKESMGVFSQGTDLGHEHELKDVHGHGGGYAV